MNQLSGEVTIRLNRGADVEGFVSQIARRYRAIESILEQAEKVGSEIKRPPYAETPVFSISSISRRSYGVAYFVDGKLAYYPERDLLVIWRGKPIFVELKLRAGVAASALCSY
jgi:hypothetical protein